MHGRVGRNIPCDLHIEHLNRRLKCVLKNLRSNIQTKSIIRAAKSIGVVDSICVQFEEQTAKLKSHLNHHKVPAADKELKLIVTSLEESPGVFCPTPNRPSAFSFRASLMDNFDQEKFEEWIV